MPRFNIELYDEKRNYRVSMQVKGNDLAEALMGVSLQIFSKVRRTGRLYRFDSKQLVLMLDVGAVTVHHC